MSVQGAESAGRRKRREQSPCRSGSLRLEIGLSAAGPRRLFLERTSTDDLESLRYEAERRWAKDETGRFRALHRHARRRGQRMMRSGLGGATHVFNVLGEGGDLLDVARSRGLTVLTDIMIALSFDSIVRREYEAFPDWGPAPVDREAAIGGGLPRSGAPVAHDGRACLPFPVRCRRFGRQLGS
jgi:hypothetical protein